MHHRASILLSGLLLAGLPPQMALADWPQDLAAEIEVVEGCRVAFLSNVVEREVDGRQVVMAKVHCEDQRLFDAWRNDPLDAFRFEECTADAEVC